MGNTVRKAETKVSMGRNLSRILSGSFTKDRYTWILIIIIIALLLLLPFLFSHTSSVDWLYNQSVMQSQTVRYAFFVFLPLLIYFTDPKIERWHTISGAVSAGVMPFIIPAFFYVCTKTPALGITAVIILALSVLFFGAVLLPDSKDPARHQPLGKRVCTVLSISKRAAFFTMAAALAACGIAVLTLPGYRPLFADEVKPANRLSGTSWADNCDYYRNYLIRLNPEDWGIMSCEEKLSVMQSIINIESANSGFSQPISVRAEVLDEYTAARYNHKNSRIVFDIDYLDEQDYIDCLSTVLHEIRHGYQHNVVDAYSSTDEAYQELVLYDSAREWLTAIEEYPNLSGSPTTDEWIDYYFNGLETDASYYAEDSKGAYILKALGYCVEDGLAVTRTIPESDPSSFTLYFFDRNLMVVNERAGYTRISVIPFGNELTDKAAALDSVSVCDLNADYISDFRFRYNGEEVCVIYNSDANAYTVADPSQLVSASDVEPRPTAFNWDSNPIDSFWESYGLASSTSSNRDLSHYKLAIADAWESELIHAYELLEGCINPAISDQQKENIHTQLDQALEHYLEYGKASSELDALAGATGFFAAPGVDSEAWPAGSGFGGYREALRGEVYREETLRIYELINEYYCFSSIDDAFAFDDKEFIELLREEYQIEVELYES